MIGSSGLWWHGEGGAFGLGGGWGEKVEKRKFDAIFGYVRVRQIAALCLSGETAVSIEGV